jgi:hypothetical protein
VIRAELQAAKKLGVVVGRPRRLTAAQIEHARKLIEAGKSPVSVAAWLSVDRSTLYRALKPKMRELTSCIHHLYKLERRLVVLGYMQPDLSLPAYMTHMRPEHVGDNPRIAFDPQMTGLRCWLQELTQQSLIQIISS